MLRKWIFVFITTCLSLSIMTAQEECSAFVQSALESAQFACQNTGRNQACYGNVALDAVPQSDAANFSFSQQGDIVDVAAIQSLQLSGYNEVAGTWGVVLMQLQANIPSTLPGQNVTVILFGDVAIQNSASSVAQQIPPEAEQTIVASTSVNVRTLPSSSAEILAAINPNESITATGRTADSQWVRVRYSEQVGWIFAELLSRETLDALLVVENPEAPVFGPMQAFYLTTGIGQPSCNAVPQDGMLVQTPQGVASIQLNVNGVDVSMGSTVYFRLDESRNLSVAPLSGSARVRANGMVRTVVEGAFVDIPLDEDLEASGIPSDIESYLDEFDLDSLPVEIFDEDIDVALGLSEEDIALIQEYDDVFEYINVEDADEFFDYINENENFDLPAYLIEEGYSDFGDDLGDFFEDLGYDLDDYEDLLDDVDVDLDLDLDIDVDDDDVDDNGDTGLDEDEEEESDVETDDADDSDDCDDC